VANENDTFASFALPIARNASQSISHADKQEGSLAMYDP
jgi:hypothetical protein